MADAQLFIKMGLEGWNGYLKRTSDLFNSLTDEQLAQETAAYLREKSVGNPDALAKIDSLLRQVYRQPEKSMVEKYTAPPSSHVDGAIRAGDALGLGA